MLFTRKTVILAKIEATYNVDPVPVVGTDAMVIQNVALTPADFDMVDRGFVRNYMGVSQQLVVGRKVMLSFEVEIAGAGTSAITKAKFDCLLRACGMSSVTNSTVSNDYAPVSTGFNSVTIYPFMDGRLHKVTGAMGNVELDFQAGQIPKLKFTFTGIYNAPSDTAPGALTLTGWQTPLGMNQQNTTGFAIHTYAGIMASLNINLNNKVTYQSLVGTGGEYVQITDRAPSGSLTIHAPDTLAIKDFFTLASTVALGNLTLTHGTAAFNQFFVTCGNVVQIINPTYGDLEGTRTIQMGLNFVPTAAGNDEFLFGTK